MEGTVALRMKHCFTGTPHFWICVPAPSPSHKKRCEFWRTFQYFSLNCVFRNFPELSSTLALNCVFRNFASRTWWCEVIWSNNENPLAKRRRCNSEECFFLRELEMMTIQFHTVVWQKCFQNYFVCLHFVLKFQLRPLCVMPNFCIRFDAFGIFFEFFQT